METLIKLDEELQEIFEGKDYVSLEDLKNKILDLHCEVGELQENYKALEERIETHYKQKTDSEFYGIN